MKSLFLLLSMIAPLASFAQCLNNTCATAHELEYCVPHELSHECTTTYEGGDLVFGTVNYPASAIGYDQWFVVTVDEPVSVTIDLLSNYSHPNATMGNYGMLEGIRFIMYTGDCGNLEPVLFSASPLGSGEYCDANQYTPNPCTSPLANWTCAGCLDNVNVGSIPYVATLLAMPQCCNGWTSQCNNRYNQEVALYNASLQAWTWQNGLGGVSGLCPFDPTVQNVEITMNLIAGTYYFQVFPFWNAQAGYVSEGDGTLNFCPMQFLSLPDEDAPESIEVVKQEAVLPRRSKVVIEGRGVYIRDNVTGRMWDMLNREIVE